MMKKALLVFVVLALVALSVSVRINNDPLRGIFNKWMVKYEKNYASAAEESTRFAIFKDNLKLIRKSNKNNKHMTLGMNQFGDLTSSEFTAQMNGYRKSNAQRNGTPYVRTQQTLPTTVDWREKGAVTGIKNQGQCGSCWSFSATGSMEGQWFLTGHSLVGLSEQNLIDCSTSYGNEGCEGGEMQAAFQYVIANSGIDTERSYPYTATGPNTCEYNAANKGATISNFKDIASGSESALLSAVWQQGPGSVAIDASQQSFQFYSGGVYNEPACSSTQLDHGVLAIGYGMYQSTTAYWLVKNSWGTSWGLNGYIMMSRDLNNQCGIATAASYPIV